MTSYLDRRFRHIGRIKKSAGTDHKKTVKQLNEMLTGLFERGRLDVLRAIKSGFYTPLQVYDAYRVNELERLPTVHTMAPLAVSFKKWAEGYDCSDKHRVSLLQSLRHIESVASKSATNADLPQIVRDLREKKKATPRQFNLIRSAAQAYIRSTIKRSHPLWVEITDVPPLKVRPTQKKNPMTPDVMRQVVAQLSAGHKRNAWGMALTGMGPNEYWGSWSVLKDRIHVKGTKRKGRVRNVPLVERIAVPYATPKAFAEALKHLKEITVKPYDFRRSYSNWMEAAGIPRTRRRIYMGHEAKDVTDLYEAHEITAFLADDAKKLRDFIGATETHNLKLEKSA